MSLTNPERVRITFEAKELTAEFATELGVDIHTVCEQALRDEV